MVDYPLETVTAVGSDNEPFFLVFNDHRVVGSIFMDGRFFRPFPWYYLNGRCEPENSTARSLGSLGLFKTLAKALDALGAEAERKGRI